MSLTPEQQSIIKDGVVWPDNLLSGIKGMSDYPLFHGYYDADYIKAYKTITWVASKMHKNGTFICKCHFFCVPLQA